MSQKAAATSFYFIFYHLTVVVVVVVVAVVLFCFVYMFFYIIVVLSFLCVCQTDVVWGTPITKINPGPHVMYEGRSGVGWGGVWWLE